VVDVPPIEPEVTEYIQYIYRYKDCGQLIYQPLPDEVKRKHFGPGILALVAIITGMLNTSKRKALAMMGVQMDMQNTERGSKSNKQCRLSL